jgi:hypothetical protein
LFTPILGFLLKIVETVYQQIPQVSLALVIIFCNRDLSFIEKKIKNLTITPFYTLS